MGLNKIFCLTGMLINTIVFIYGIKWALTFFQNDNILTILPALFIFTMCHELMHALVWWYFGYFAIPIPILIPPLLGITIGDKTNIRSENILISLSPVLLTITAIFVFLITENDGYLILGLLNLICMFYDFFSVFNKDGA